MAASNKDAPNKKKIWLISTLVVILVTVAVGLGMVFGISKPGSGNSITTKQPAENITTEGTSSKSTIETKTLTSTAVLTSALSTASTTITSTTLTTLKPTTTAVSYLISTFQNATISLTLSSYGSSSFQNAYGFSSSPSTQEYYISDYHAQDIIIFDQYWNFVARISMTSPAHLRVINDFVYVTQDNFFTKNTLTSMVNLASYSSPGANYRGIYYEQLLDIIYVANENNMKIDVFNTNLTLLRSINLSPYKPFRIAGFNDTLYVSATNLTGFYILLLRNESIFQVISLACQSNAAGLLLEGDRYIAAACHYNNIVYLYHTNGLFTGKSISVTGTSLSDLGFDLTGRFVVLAQTKLYVYK